MASVLEQVLVVLRSHPWLSGVGTLIIGVVTVLLLADASLTWKLRHIPSPPSLPVVGHLRDMLSEPWRRFRDFNVKYGSVYLVRIFNKPVVVISDPALVKYCFRDRADIYLKDQWSYSFMRDVLGYGLVTSEGETWKAHRSMMMPAFDFKALENLQLIFEDATSRFLKQGDLSELSMTPLGNGSALLELSSAFRQVTLEVISEVALGFKAADASVFPALFEVVLDELNKRPYQPWRAFLPWIEMSHRSNVTTLNNIVLQTIRARRAIRAAAPAPRAQVAATPQATLDATTATSTATPGDDNEDGVVDTYGNGSGMSLSGKPIFGGGGDMLDMMLDSGVEMTDTQLLDQLKTQLMAGHETSSMMLTWAVYLLARNPAAMAKAVAEVDAALGLAPGVTETSVATATTREKPTFKDYRSLTYLEYVLKEAMRLYSPVPILNRELQVEDVVGGYKIPAKTTIMVSIWSLHMRRDIWGDDVNEFRPERFAPEESKSRHAWSYLPFSLGARSCIGQNLAITEAKTVMGSLLRQYSLSLPANHVEPVTDCYIIPLRPESPLNVIATPRK